MTDPRRSIDQDCQNLSGRLKAIRSYLGLTQQELADRLGDLGVKCPRGVVAKFEVGLQQVTLPVAMGYAEIAGLTVEQLANPQPVELRVSI